MNIMKKCDANIKILVEGYTWKIISMWYDENGNCCWWDGFTYKNGVKVERSFEKDDFNDGQKMYYDAKYGRL